MPESPTSKEALIEWKTNAWAHPGMVAWYQDRMVESKGTTLLKNQVELSLCQRFAEGTKLLDVGIGTGRASLPLARAGFEVTGVDSSQAMLDRCAALAGDLPVVLQRQDLARLEFADACFDTLVSLNVLVHFPHWRDVLGGWCRVVRPGGRILFDIHSREHDLAAAAGLGIPPPEAADGPDGFTCRIHAHELVEAANALGLGIVAVTPYVGVFAGGNVNYWLASSLASGARFDRLLSWLAQDEKLFAFALFLEQEVFGVLTPKATGRMMVVLENRPDPSGNEAWLANCRRLEAVLARQGVQYDDLAGLVPSWDEAWKARLNAHLAWPRNRVLLHMLLSNFPGRVDLSGFLEAAMAETLMDWQRRYVQNLLTHRALRRFVEEPAFDESLDYKGVNLRAGLEYDFTREMLSHYFKAFPET